MKRVLPLFAALCLFPLLSAKAAHAQKLEVTPVNSPSLKKAIGARKGRVVVVDFWATWCEPCVARMPALLKLRKKYAARGFDLMLVSADDIADRNSKVAPFLKRSGANFPTWILQDDVFKFIAKFDPDLKTAFALPRAYVYNRARKRVKVLGADDSPASLEKTIAALL